MSVLADGTRPPCDEQPGNERQNLKQTMFRIRISPAITRHKGQLTAENGSHIIHGSEETVNVTASNSSVLWHGTCRSHFEPEITHFAVFHYDNVNGSVIPPRDVLYAFQHSQTSCAGLRNSTDNLNNLQ